MKDFEGGGYRMWAARAKYSKSAEAQGLRKAAQATQNAPYTGGGANNSSFGYTSGDYGSRGMNYAGGDPRSSMSFGGYGGTDYGDMGDSFYASGASPYTAPLAAKARKTRKKVMR
jgi:hypothetical protein